MKNQANSISCDVELKTWEALNSLEALFISRHHSLPSSRNWLEFLWSGDVVLQRPAPQSLPNIRTLLSSICSTITAATKKAWLVCPDSHPFRVLPGFSRQSDVSRLTIYMHTNCSFLLPWKKANLVRLVQVRKCLWTKTYLANIKSCTVWLFHLSSY